MASLEINDPKIITYARRGFAHYLAAGDTQTSALDKAIRTALAKLWRRKPLDMTSARNIARNGRQFAHLKRSVLEGDI